MLCSRTDSTYFLSSPAAGALNGTAYSPNDGNTWVIADALIHTDIDFVNDSTAGWTGSNELDALMFKWNTPIRVPLTEVEVSSIDVGSNTGLQLQTPKATVKNNSLGCTHLWCYHDDYGWLHFYKTVTGLSFGNTFSGEFWSMDSAATGPYTIVVYSSLSGDTDNNNDTNKRCTCVWSFRNYGWENKTDPQHACIRDGKRVWTERVYSSSPGTLYTIGGTDGAAVVRDAECLCWCFQQLVFD